MTAFVIVMLPLLLSLGYQEQLQDKVKFYIDQQILLLLTLPQHALLLKLFFRR